MAPKPNKFKQFLIDFAEKKVENWKKEIAGKEPVVPNFYDDLTPVDDVEKSLPYTNDDPLSMVSVTNHASHSSHASHASHHSRHR
jgi:hypothetical protein